MAVPGTGSTNQSLTFAASKKVAGKAHTSNLKEIYNETIPSNIQIDTSTIFAETIPTSVTSDTGSLYTRFSASLGGNAVVEYVDFYVESISGTTYDANDGTFGDVGFGGGDEAQPSGPHGYQLRLTSSYQAQSSNPGAGSGFLTNNQIVHQSNGALQLLTRCLVHRQEITTDCSCLQNIPMMVVCKYRRQVQLNFWLITLMV